MEDALGDSDALIARQATPRATEELVCAHYEKFAAGVERYLVRMTGDPGHSEDLVQETFLRLYAEILNKREVNNPRAWLFQVAHNLAIDFLRQRGQEAWVVDEQLPGERADLAPDAETALLNAERRKQVRRGLWLLTPQERQVLELRAEGLTYKEIAGLMELQISTAATFLSRAVQKIARQIDG